MKNVLVLDGSLQGKSGNTAQLVRWLCKDLLSGFSIDYLELKTCHNILAEEHRFRKADGLVFGTGTYWQSWSSHAQRFFEEATPWEGTEIWLGKPVCTLVTMHSVGGLEVLGRIQSNFSLLGAFIPPMCGLAISYVNQRANRCMEQEQETADLWGIDDIPVVAHNFREALLKTHNYKAWQVDALTATGRLWIKK